MLSTNSNVENHAWEVASDPSAKEEKWMAAMTLLEGKNVVARTNPRPPRWVALPWGIVSTIASASGAVIVFSSLQYTLGTGIAQAVMHQSMLTAGVPLIFGFFSVPCLVFSMLFTYKRLMYDGGSAWKVAHWSAILLFLSGMTLIAIDGKPVSFSDGGLLLAWNFACFTLSVMGTKLAEQTFKGLNQTIGARRVLVPMLRSFAAVPVLTTLLVFSGALSGYTIHNTLLFVSAVMMASSYLTVKKLNAVDSRTASSIATIIWTPTILANIALLPALAGTQLWLLFSNTPLIGWIDYAGGLAALTVSLMAPLAGGYVASKQLQMRAARGLGRRNERLSFETNSCPPSTLEKCFDE